jgi:hypothetical protein
MQHLIIILLANEPSNGTIIFPWGTVIAAMSVIITMIIGFWQAGRRSGGIETSIKNIDSDVSSIKEKVDNLRISNKAITTVLVTKFDIDHALFVDNSPTALSELGNRIIKESGGKAYLDDNDVLLLEKLQNMEYSSQLDIQNNAYFLLLGLANEPGMSAIKDFIFEHPVYLDVKLDMPTILKAMSIYLRDIMIDSVAFDSDFIPEE